MTVSAATSEHFVGRADEFEEGRFRIVDVENRSIGVVRAGGTFFAVLNICPHALAPVCEGSITGTTLPCLPGEEPAFGLENRILRCPWHHYEFDLGAGGQSVFTDFRARVRLFPVRVEDGDVYIAIRTRSDAAKDPRTRGRSRGRAQRQTGPGADARR